MTSLVLQATLFLIQARMPLVPEHLGGSRSDTNTSLPPARTPRPAPERPQGHRPRVELRAGTAERLTGIPFPCPEPAASPPPAPPGLPAAAPPSQRSYLGRVAAGPGPGSLPGLHGRRDPELRAVRLRGARARRRQCLKAGGPRRGGLGSAALPALGTGTGRAPCSGQRKASVRPCLALAVGTVPTANRLLRMRGQNFLKGKDLCCLKKKGFF